MTLLANWREVLSRAWSVRLMILAGLLSGLEIAFPLLDGYVDIPRNLFASLAALTTAAAVVARLLVQRNVPGKDC